MVLLYFIIGFTVALYSYYNWDKYTDHSRPENNISRLSLLLSLFLCILIWPLFLLFALISVVVATASKE